MKKPSKPVVVTVGSVKLPIYSTPTNGRERFTLAWYEAGQRKRKVFEDLAAAKKHAEEVGIKLAKGNLAALRLTAADHESYVIAMRDLLPFGIPLHAAVAEYVAARKALPQGVPILTAAEDYASRMGQKLTPLTPSEAATALMKSKRADNLDAGYVRQLEQSLTRFANAFRQQLLAIKTADVQAWIRREGGAPKTQNHLRADLVTLAKYAQEQLHALPPGKTAFEKVGRLREPEREIGILHPPQMVALLASANAAKNHEALLWYAIGGFAGLRPNEAMRLTWDEIDLTRGYIRVKGGKSKTGAKRLVPIHANLKAWLAGLAKSKGPVFKPNAHERAQYFAKGIKTPIPFDGLRHSYGTYRTAQLADTARTAHEMGNSPAVVVKHYDRVALPEEAIAWFAILPDRPANVLSMEAA